MIRVLVAARSPVVRAGLESLINASGTLTVVGAAADEAALSQQAEELRPDAVLAEIDPHDEATTAAIAALGAGPRSPAIVALAAGEAPGSWELEMLRSGARAVLPRETTASEIVAAIEAAAAGLVILHPASIESLLQAQPPVARAAPASQQTLTPREIEVLAMIAEGDGNKTIAWRLGISEHTVKFHIASIFAKLGAASRTEAVTLGIRQGLIMI
jgi:DNA-binding NarL/FixJ family response regulator